MKSLAKLFEKCEGLYARRLTRRGFLKVCLALAGLFVLTRKEVASGALFEGTKVASNARRRKGSRGTHDLVVANGSDPAALVKRAVDAIGGISRFVSQGDVVVVKPNIAWDRSPEQAGNTNPLVVGAVVELAYQAGARKVKVFDIPCNEVRRCYENSGIRRAAEEKGASVFYPDTWNSVPAHFAYESPMEDWPILRDALECDTFINVPVLKHHGLTGLTISMKNLMGVCCGSRGQIHQGIGRKLVDLTDLVSPDLTVVDAYRVLLRNGPSGGNLADVQEQRNIVVSHDPVLADVYACQLMNVSWQEISYLAQAAERGFGISDLNKADVLDLRVSA